MKAVRSGLVARGLERGHSAHPHGSKLQSRVTNRENIVTFHTSCEGGQSWARFHGAIDASGYHHNVRGGFLMVRPEFCAAGPGEAIFRDFRFTAL